MNTQLQSSIIGLAMFLIMLLYSVFIFKTKPKEKDSYAGHHMSILFGVFFGLVSVAGVVTTGALIVYFIFK